MAEDIKTTPQHWATIHVDFENRLYIAIAIGYRVYIIYDIVKKFLYELFCMELAVGKYFMHKN